MEENKSTIVQYNRAAEVIKTAILQGQYEALKNENRIQLAVYFSIGKYVSENSRSGKWGTGALAAISSRLKKYCLVYEASLPRILKDEIVL